MSDGLFLEMVILFKCFGIFFMIQTYAQLNGSDFSCGTCTFRNWFGFYFDYSVDYILNSGRILTKEGVMWRFQNLTPWFCKSMS